MERECSRREKQREGSSAVNSSEFRFALACVCCVFDSKNLDYFVITLKIDEFASLKE